MFRTGDSELERFRTNLDRWRSIVHSVLRRGHAPRGVTSEKYILLHRELLEFVQQGEPNASGQRNQLRQSLYHTMRPWVSLETLTHSDRRTLKFLEQDVDNIVRDSLGARSHRRWRLIALSLAVVIAATTIGLSMRTDASSTTLSTVFDQAWHFVQGAKARLWHGIAESSTNQRLTIMAGSIVLMGMLFLRNPKRF